MLPVLLDTVQQRSYKINDRPFELNIVGVRADNVVPNRFDDTIYVFFRNNIGKWILYPFSATTDPGTYWLQHPMNQDGTAIMKEGQYVDAYQIGLHRNQYLALVQRKPVTVYRDYDRNAVLDFMNGEEQTGFFGINIHRASVSGTTKFIDKFSAGCQVMADANDFKTFMQLCEQHRNLYGNQFTYTLIDERALARKQRRQFWYYAGGIGAGVTLAFLTYKILKL